MAKARNGAELLVECLEAQGVKYIFGIPGAKVDTIFDCLADHGPQLILCRHEQNAAFMAGMYGLLTGTPGVCLVTSGPGVTNLATGLSTATLIQWAIHRTTWSGDTRGLPNSASACDALLR